MTKLSTAAWVAHSLGLGACFGGTLFGKFLSSAWNRYNAVSAASLGTAAGTWFVGRAGSTRWSAVSRFLP